MKAWQASRAIYFVLDPMSVGEMNNQPHSDILVRVLNGEFPEESSLTAALPDPTQSILRGFMPPLLRLGQGGGKDMWLLILNVIFDR